MNTAWTRSGFEGLSGSPGDRSFRLRVISLTSYVVPLRSETSAAHVYASFSQPWYKKVRYASIYLLLSATDQAKAVRGLTQHVRETTSQVGEQDVGETTRRRNDRRPLTPTDYPLTSLEFPIPLGVSGHLATNEIASNHCFELWFTKGNFLTVTIFYITKKWPLVVKLFCQFVDLSNAKVCIHWTYTCIYITICIIKSIRSLTQGSSIRIDRFEIESRI